MGEVSGSDTRCGAPSGTKRDALEAFPSAGYRCGMSSSTARPLRGTGLRRQHVACRLAEGDREVTVWLEVSGQRRSIVGRINKFLARDALRHGQDLVEELLDKARIKAERMGLAERQR